MGAVLENHREERQETEAARRNTELIEASIVRNIEGEVRLIHCECGLYWWITKEDKQCMFCGRKP